MDSATTPTSRSTILLVEDDRTIRTIITDFLQDEGYTVIAVVDGGQAIASLRASQPPPEELGLVILDMRLPVASGLDVLRALAVLGSYVPVIAMSADEAQLIRAEAAGATSTMSKPFDFERLLAVVKANCGP